MATVKLQSRMTVKDLKQILKYCSDETEVAIYQDHSEACSEVYYATKTQGFNLESDPDKPLDLLILGQRNPLS